MINIQSYCDKSRTEGQPPEQLLRKATGEKESFDISDYKNKYDQWI
jgi:hypothetical protein